MRKKFISSNFKLIVAQDLHLFANQLHYVIFAIKFDTVPVCASPTLKRAECLLALSETAQSHFKIENLETAQSRP